MNYVRIRKQQARKLYNADCEVVMVGHKMYPFGGWSFGYHVSRPDMLARCASEDDAQFDSIVQNHGWYNLSWEEGYYQAFYVRASDARKHNIPTMDVLS